MSPAEATFLNALLPRGRANACSVPHLARCTGWNERAVREGLEHLLTEYRVPVCTLPVKDGVYVAVTPEECDAADRNLRSRALAILRRRRALRLAGERLAWSPTLFDL